MRVVPVGATTAFARFVFQTQPRLGQRVRVVWYRADGRPIGTIPKANRPTVDTWITGSPGLPSETYRVQLWAGSRLVKTLSVPVR